MEIFRGLKEEVLEEGFIVKQEAKKRKGGEKGEDGEIDVVGIKGETFF